MAHVGESTVTVYDPEGARSSSARGAGKTRSRPVVSDARRAPTVDLDEFEVGTSPPSFVGPEAEAEHDAPPQEEDVRALWIAAWTWVAAAGTLLAGALLWGVS